MKAASLWGTDVPRLSRRNHLPRWPARLAATIRAWRQRRASRDELARLDPRLLRDIGLTPADAWLEINKPFWRE
jgi:uncharacterized protein YjiS (DUF1127 family)